MNINTEIKTSLVFKVEAFWNEEGGMGCDSFGGKYKTLEEAVFALHLAKANEAKRCESEKNRGLKHISPTEWIITGYMSDAVIVPSKESF
jgi:hypothetical protein